MKTVGIISKPRPELREIVPELVRWLAGRGISALLDRETARSLGPHSGPGGERPVEALGPEGRGRPAGGGSDPGHERAQIAERVELLVVLGGDGTLLAAARAAGGRGLPVLGVNLGSLGFLTEITLDEMYPALELVIEGRHEVDCRHKLLVEVRRRSESGLAQVIESYHALNDAVITTAALARIMDLDAYMDGQFVSNFKADGLIVATPTGSTAYSLSAGGPIVLPAVDAMLITPIASHMLTNRPLVVPGNASIEVVVNSPEESVFLTVDGQVGMSIQKNDRVVCRVSPELLRLVRPPGRSYFEVLSDKLKWGHR